MRAEYDFSKGKRGAVIAQKGKTRISIFLDNAVLAEFRARSEKAGTGYQTMINEALRTYLAQAKSGIHVEASSGNVYADLGLKDADQLLVKAELVAVIASLIEGRNLKQSSAAELLGLTQPKLSNLLRGQFRGFSERRLMDCLTRLGLDVQIVVKPTPRSRGLGRLSVKVVAAKREVRHLKGLVAKPGRPVRIAAMTRAVARAGSGK